MALRPRLFGSGFTLSNALAIFDATECAVCSSFLSATIQAPEMGNVIAPAAVSGFRWHGIVAEYDAKPSYSAACYQQIEHTGVLSVIVPESELGEVERKVLLRNVMETPHDSAFEQCPKAFDAVGMNDSTDIFASSVPYNFMRQSARCEHPITSMFIGIDKLDPIANCLADETVERWRVGVLNDLADNVTFSADSADHSGLSGEPASPADTLIAMSIPVLTADECFVYFNDAHESLELFVVHCGADASTHIPDGFVAGLIVKDGALNLKSTHALLRVQHQEADCEPSLERVFGILEHRAGNEREPIAFLCALVALPMPCATQLVNFLRVATRALDLAIWPAMLEEEQFAGFFGWEKSIQFAQLDHAKEFSKIRDFLSSVG